MFIKSIVFYLIFMAAIPVVAQRLTMFKTFGGARYYQSDTVELSPRQVREILQTNETAQTEFHKGMVMNNVSGIMGFCGGILVAVPAGSLVLGGQPEWSLAAVGIALLGGSIAMEVSHRKKARGAIDLYNMGISRQQKFRLHFAATSTSLVFQF
jgi:hypothetical protein